MTTELTPKAFDALTRAAPNAREDRIIWTAAAIGGRIGCGEDYVRKTLAHEPGTPIRKRGRRFYAFEDDLIAWMRSAA